MAVIAFFQLVVLQQSIPDFGKILIGVLRIIRGWPIQYLIIGGYIGLVIMTAFAPEEITGVACDSSGATTCTVTVPLVTALGLGLSSNIPGRNPMLDGSGLIAFTCMFPIMKVMAYAQITQWYLKRSKAKHE